MKKLELGVGERPLCSEAHAARRGGAQGSENVGTSNRNPDENSGRRKTKVSFAMSINEGLVGPKVMAKAGTDGQRVNIPSLFFGAME